MKSILWYWTRGIYNILTIPAFLILCFMMVNHAFSGVIQTFALFVAAKQAWGFWGFVAATCFWPLPLLMPAGMYYSLLKNLPGLWMRLDATLAAKIRTSVGVCLLFPLMAYVIFKGCAYAIAWIADIGAV